MNSNTENISVAIRSWSIFHKNQDRKCIFIRTKHEKKQIENGKMIHRNNWSCREDHLVLPVEKTRKIINLKLIICRGPDFNSLSQRKIPTTREFPLQKRRAIANSINATQYSDHRIHLPRIHLSFVAEIWYNTWTKDDTRLYQGWTCRKLLTALFLDVSLFFRSVGIFLAFVASFHKTSRKYQARLYHCLRCLALPWFLFAAFDFSQHNKPLNTIKPITNKTEEGIKTHQGTSLFLLPSLLSVSVSLWLGIAPRENMESLINSKFS